MSQQPLASPNGTGREPLWLSERLPEPPPRMTRPWVHALLLALAAATTTITGMTHSLGFDQPDGIRLLDWLRGAGFSFGILGILIAHEMGHYLYCRYYRIPATLPYVIPFIPIYFGTLGAVIRILAPFRNRRQLFDVGIGGPIAGFLVLVPVLLLALSWSSPMDMPEVPGEEGFLIIFETPLLFHLLRPWFFPLQEGQLVLLHPIGWAAVFGMLATSLNLLPMGQLDGGHIVYALFGRRVHEIVSHLTFAGLIALSLFSWPTPAYLLFALLIRFLGFRHPPPVNPEGRLGRGRIAAAAAALIILVLTFVPVPIRMP